MNSNIKILSWNINGLRTQKDNFKDFLDSLQADIICFQETKITRDQLEEFLAIIDGYVSFFSFSRKRSGYSGVATFCKKELTPSFAQEGLSGTLSIGSLTNNGGSPNTLLEDWDIKDLKDLDLEGRCIITQHPFLDENGEKKLVTIINVYCPRADPDKPERASYKLSFYKLLRQRASVIRESGSFVVILGDLNISHKKIDHCDPCDDEEFDAREDRKVLDDFLLKTTKEDISTNNGTENFLSATRENEFESMNCPSSYSVKMVDTFRYYYPNKEKCFTCWNMKINARSTNYGTRIDYVLCDENFLAYVSDAFIHEDIEGSDHCPVSVNLVNTKFLSDHSLPKICTKFYPEFHGNQQKLLSYFKPNSGVNGVNPIFNNNLDTFTKSKIEPNLKRKLGETNSNNTRKKRNEVKQFTMKSFLIKNYDSHGSSESSSSSYQNTDSESEPNSQKLTEDPESTIKSLSENILNSNQLIESDFKRQENSDKTKDISKSNAKKNSGWGFMMRGPAPPPLCSGHKEPCVLRTVKKKGSNFNKQFYACARGGGKEGDPQCQCNFFKWFNGR